MFASWCSQELARLACAAQRVFVSLQGGKDRNPNLSKLMHDAGQVKNLEVSLLKGQERSR